MNKLLIIFSLVALVGLSFADSKVQSESVSIKRKSNPPNDDGPAPGGIRPPKRIG